jgi:hypothetical protein
MGVRVGMIVRAGVAALALEASSAAQAGAQEIVCAAPSAGMVSCIAGRLCACAFAPGSPATGLPDGFRWDCGILRPRCGPPVPATLDPWQGDLPEALAVAPPNAPRPPRPRWPDLRPPG